MGKLLKTLEKLNLKKITWNYNLPLTFYISGKYHEICYHLEEKSCKFFDNEYKSDINYYKMEILESNEKHVKKHFNILKVRLYYLKLLILSLIIQDI